MAHLVGSLAGLLALIAGGIWLRKAHDTARKPLAVAMPLCGGVMGILIVVLGTSAADRNFGVNHSLWLVLLILLGVVVGFALGHVLSRDYYKTRDGG